VTLADLNPTHGYTLILEGNGGIAGSVKGRAKVRLSADAGGTLVSYEVDAQVAGRMAQLGGPLIDATAKQIAGKFFSRFGESVGGGARPTEPAVQKPQHPPRRQLARLRRLPAPPPHRQAVYPWPGYLRPLSRRSRAS